MQGQDNIIIQESYEMEIGIVDEGEPYIEYDIDLYDHLKVNIKEFEKNCKDINDGNFMNLPSYCLLCKSSVCSLCNLESHKHESGSAVISGIPSQCLIKKNNFEMKRETITKIFSEVDNEIKFHEDSYNYDFIINELKSSISDRIQTLHEKLDDFKSKKFLEIENLISDDDLSTSTNILKTTVEDIKTRVNLFFSNHKMFFNSYNFNNDSCNTIFLIIFEMLKLCKEKNKDIKKCLQNIKAEYHKYKSNLDDFSNNVYQILENLIIDLDEEFNFNSMIEEYKKVKSDIYQDIKLRLNIYDQHIENFKTISYEFISKSGSYAEIEKIVNLYDNKNVPESGISLFFNDEIKIQVSSPNKNHKNSSSNSVSPSFMPLSNESKILKKDASLKKIYSQSDLKKQSEGSNTSPTKIIRKIKNKCDIILDNELLSRYFSYSTLDTVNKNLRIKLDGNKTTTTQPQNSDYDPDPTDCKPLTGTNEIQIYDRKKRILIKKKVDLDKQTHGYFAFLDGSRYILIGDRLFITGGRDPSAEYNIVLLYDTREFHLKRLPDMNYNRSYHTMEYTDVYKTIIVVGGENNPTCEIFDIFSNKWHELPQLNHPRANVSLHFDKYENQIYALFGMKGDITQKNNNIDVIEVLNLKDLSKGWTNLFYMNNCSFDFKMNLCRIFSLSRDKLLIYGANSPRNTLKSFAVFNKSNRKIMNLNKLLLEEIKLQAKDSARLSKLVSIIP